MPTLTIVPPMPGAERRFRPFTEFVQAQGWATEFVKLHWEGPQPAFGNNSVVMGFSLGALYAHLGALDAKHLILGSISPFFLEDDDEPQRWLISLTEGNAATPADVLVGSKEDAQMHRRAESIRDFYQRSTYTVVPKADHELWHPNYLAEIGRTLRQLEA